MILFSLSSLPPSLSLSNFELKYSDEFFYSGLWSLISSHSVNMYNIIKSLQFIKS